MILTARQKADWMDRYSSDQWECVMERKLFPAVVTALTEGNLDRADQIMQGTISVNDGHQLNGGTPQPEPWGTIL